MKARIYEATISVERGEQDIDLVVRGTCDPIIPARTSGPPENCSPQEGGDVEVTGIFLDVGNGKTPFAGELTDDELEHAKERLFEVANEVWADEYECQADAYADAHEDDDLWLLEEP